MREVLLDLSPAEDCAQPARLDYAWWSILKDAHPSRPCCGRILSGQFLYFMHSKHELLSRSCSEALQPDILITTAQPPLPSQHDMT